MGAWNMFSISLLWFNLNCRVENTILRTFANFINISDDILTKSWSDVTSHNILASSKTPAMEVVDLFNCLQFDDIVVELLNIDIIWSGLHDNFNTVTEDWDSGHKDQDWKDVGANGIYLLPFWAGFKFKNNRSCNYTNALNHIAKNMDECSPDVHILFNAIRFIRHWSWHLTIVLRNEIFSTVCNLVHWFRSIIVLTKLKLMCGITMGLTLFIVAGLNLLIVNWMILCIFLSDAFVSLMRLINSH